MIISNEDVEADASKDSDDVETIHGKDGWGFILVALGLALAIEGTLIQMLTSLVFPWNILVDVALAFITLRLLMFCGRFLISIAYILS